MRQNVNHGLLQVHAGQVQGLEGACHGPHVAVHLGRLAQKNVHGHVHRRFISSIDQLQLALFGGNTNHRKRATLALAQGPEQLQGFRGDGQHIAFLALVAPDFLGRHAGFLELYGAQIEARTAPCVVSQLGEGVAQAASAHVVDGEDGVAATGGAAICAHHPALVDHLLRPALNLGVAALHRVKVQLRRIGAGGHGAGRTAAHADTHAGATQLDQKAAGGELHLVGLLGVDDAQTARDHDGLVVAAHHGVHIAGHGLFVFAEVAQQVGPAEFVVEGRAAQGAFDHDLQRAGNVPGLATHLVGHAAPELGDGKAGQARLGLGAAAGGALVADLAACTGGGAGERGNRGRVVVGFHLHQNVIDFAMLFVAGCAYPACSSGRFGCKSLDLHAFHHRGVVRVRHQHVLRMELVRVADHAEHALVLRHAVDGELGVEDFVAAVFAVGLGKHHQFHVGGVAAQRGECVHQVINLISGKGQAKLGVGSYQSIFAARQYVHMVHGRGLQGIEQLLRLGTVQHGAFGHSVVQQGAHSLQLLRCQGAFAQQTILQAQAILHQPLYPLHGQAAVVGNVGSLGGPRAHRAETRAHHNRGPFRRPGVRVTVGQQCGQLVSQGLVQSRLGRSQMHETGCDTGNFVAHAVQRWQELLDAEMAEGIAALECGDVQGHCGGLVRGEGGSRMKRGAGQRRRFYPCKPACLRWVRWDNRAP